MEYGYMPPDLLQQMALQFSGGQKYAPEVWEQMQRLWGNYNPEGDPSLGSQIAYD
jgi:hypothetical protein